MALNEVILNKIKTWREDAVLFVQEVLLINKPHIKISKQQMNFLRALPKEKRISIRSGHGTGKDASASWAVLWFLATRAYAKVVCTAPTARQLNDILWSEISKWARDSAIQDEFVIQSEKIFHKGAPKEWWARAVSPSVKADPADQAETLAGFHGDHLLIVVDEACHDDQTEVLTENGFKLFADVETGERVLTMNQETHIAEYVYPTEYHSYDYDGNLHYYESDNLDFAVTPNHKMFFNTRDVEKYQLKPIKDIGRTRLTTPKGFRWTGQHLDAFSSYELYQAGWEPFEITSWLAFLGIFISEGYYTKYADGRVNGLGISQSKLEGKEMIAKILNATGLNYRVHGNEFRISSVSLAEYLQSVCGDGFINKRVPDFIKQLTPELINVFLNAFCVGDGYFKPFNGGYRRIFYTSSPQLSNDIQELLFKAGYNATIQYRKLEGKTTWIRDHFATSSVDGFAIGESSTETAFSIRMENVKIRPYTGKVYCLTVPTGILFTRRNGKCFWSGNSGVEDPVFIPIEGALTQEDNRVMLIGNPTKNKGYFHDTQFHSEISKMWFKLHWDSRDSENVKPDYPVYMANKYGVDSNVFRIRVAGLPPLEDERTLIPLYWAEQCIGKYIEVDDEEPIYLGVDVARFGEDKSIILPRHGLRVLPWITFQGMNTITLAGNVQMTYGDVAAEGCAIDVIGVGAGVADYLRKQRMPNLFDVNVSWASSESTKYALLRDELWWRVREKCMYGYYSFPDIKLPGETLSLGQELANELSSPYYEFNRNGAVKVEGKKEMKKRGIASPNIADALCITEYFYSASTKLFRKVPKGPQRGKAYKPSMSTLSKRRIPGADAWQVM
jgi:hypothetical protein